jgi:hypothetical protein
MANQYTKARAAAAIEERQARQEAAGIPDSAPPIASEREQTWRDTCHVGGLPVSQLPPDLVARLTFAHTDEGIAEIDREYAIKLAQGRISRIDMESDEATERKRFGPQRDALLNGASIEEADNPMQELMDEHLEPGQRGRWLDPEVCGALGMRGYKPVIVDGEKVQCGQSYLGYIPEDVAQARERKRDSRNADKLALIQQQVQEQVGQLSHAQKSAGLPEGATGAPHSAGLHISRDIEIPPARERG